MGKRQFAGKAHLERLLVVGARIRIGAEYAAQHGGYAPYEIVTLVEGTFERDNGLYTVQETAPAAWHEDDWASIYHLFGNNLEDFLDCEVLPVERSGS